ARLTGELDLPIRNALPLLEPPLLIISGERDAQHPRKEMEDLAILAPHAALEVISDAGAAVFEDRPDAFTASTLTWRGRPADRHLLDMSTLLPPMDAMGTPIPGPSPTDYVTRRPLKESATSEVASVPATDEAVAITDAAVDTDEETKENVEAAETPETPTRPTKAVHPRDAETGMNSATRSEEPPAAPA